MKRVLIFFLSLFLISCSTDVKEQKTFTNKLKAIDEIVYNNPFGARDSLNLISKDLLSEENLAYYNLLWNIMKDKCGAQDWKSTDTLIYRSLKWYRQSSDKYNLCRALLYSGINKHIDPDTSGFAVISEAEKIFKKHSLTDIETKASIYRYLGKILNYNYWVIVHSPKLIGTLPDQYLNMSMELYKSIGKENEADLVKIDMLRVIIYSHKPQHELLAEMDKMAAREDLSDEVRFKLYQLFSSYYQGRSNYEKAIFYKKEIISNNLAQPTYSDGLTSEYEDLAILYKFIGDLDSSIVYSDKAIESSKEVGNYYFRAYSNKSACLKEKKEKEAAYEAFRKYYDYHVSHIVFANINKIKEIRSRATTDLLYANLSKERYKRHLQVSLIISFLAVLSSALLLYIYLRNRKRCIKVKNNTDHAINAVSQEITKMRLINDILRIPTANMSQTLDNVSIEAARLRKVSKESSDILNNFIIDIRNNTKNDISEIARSEKFASQFPEVASLNELSPYEKIILVLANYGYSNKEIADILANNHSSIRTLKSKLKEKILISGDLSFDPTTTFPFLNKDLNKSSDV